MNHRKRAAALKYEGGYEAPVVTAAGIGKIAENIINGAKENNVPVVYDQELTALLTNLDIGESIPFELYEAVAKVIAYVMDVDKSINGR
ncbi:MAG: EscU/YscU/HrcU family type III secretion system export apparatus switch protein [Solirubrobacterales bacterium]